MATFNMLGWGSLVGGIVLLLPAPRLRLLIASKLAQQGACVTA
ncbi:hypothetical protein [Aeromonas jandaei]